MLAPYAKVGTVSSDADVTDQVEFLGLPTFDKWDVRDGRSGRKYLIKDETRKTESQLENCILNHLNGSDQLLARDILHTSPTISYVFYTFISTSYEDTMHYGKFNSAQSWKLTSSFVKKIFT